MTTHQLIAAGGPAGRWEDAERGGAGFLPRHPYEHLPILVTTGVGRSGTTALRNAIERHPAIRGTDRENNIVYDVLEVARLNCLAPSRVHAMRVTPTRYDEVFRRTLLELLWPTTGCAPSVGAAKSNESGGTSGDAQALHMFTALTPERAAYLRRIFPGGRVRVVHIVRNGIEVVSSRIRFEGFKSQGFEGQCRVWAEDAAMWREGMKRSDTLVVRHERLRTDAEGVLCEVWRLAGFSGDASHCQQAIDLLEGKIYHPTPEEPGAAASTDLEHRASRWQGWTREERESFERLCGEAMRELGYAMPWSEASVVVRSAARERVG